MKTFVVFLKSDLYDKDSFKCIVSNVNEENIILAHSHVYPDVTFEIFKKIPLYDEFLFSYFIQKVPQYKSAFVSLSFNDNSKYESSKIPHRVFAGEQQELILEIINYINKLTALLPLENNTILNDNQEELENYKFIKTGNFLKTHQDRCSPFLKNENVNENVNRDDFNSNELMGFSDDIDQYDEIYPIHYNCTDLFWISNSYNNSSMKYLIMDKGFTFDYTLFTKLFPELDIKVYRNFPNIPLAEQMFDYQINLYGSVNCSSIPLKDIIDNINDFLISKIQSIKVSDIKEDSKEDLNVHMKQFNIIKDFLETKCQYSLDNKIQSTVLFNHFLEFCQEQGQDEIMSHTKFSRLFKQASLFETTRKSNAMYWINLDFKK
jgi:hypothetical protein